PRAGPLGRERPVRREPVRRAARRADRRALRLVSRLLALVAARAPCRAGAGAGAPVDLGGRGAVERLDTMGAAAAGLGRRPAGDLEEVIEWGGRRSTYRARSRWSPAAPMASAAAPPRRSPPRAPPSTWWTSIGRRVRPRSRSCGAAAAARASSPATLPTPRR